MWRRCEINVDQLLVWQLLPIFLLRTGHNFCTFIDIVHENRDWRFAPTKFQVIWIRLSKTLWPKIKHFKAHGLLRDYTWNKCQWLTCWSHWTKRSVFNMKVTEGTVRLTFGSRRKAKDRSFCFMVHKGEEIYIYIYIKKIKTWKYFASLQSQLLYTHLQSHRFVFLTKQSNIVPFLKNLVNLNATVKKSVWYSAQSGIIYSTDILRVNWVFTVQFCVSTSTLVLFVYLLFFKVLFKIVFGPLHGYPSCWCNGAFVLLASHTIVSIYVFDCRTSFHSILVFCSACVFFSSTCT